MKTLWRRLQVLFRRERFDRELREEMECHRYLMEQEGLEQGARPDEAARQAAIHFGNPTALAETSRESWGWGPLERLLQDLRYAARTLRKSPVFTLTVIAVLALGIGANTAAFSALRAVILRPLAFPDAERIVLVNARHSSGRNGGTGIADFLDWRAQNTVFDSMAIFPWIGGYTLTGEGDPQRVKIASTTYGFQDVLGFQPTLGRFFSEAEDRPGGPRVTLISYEAWQRRYHGEAGILGRNVVLDGVPHTVIGVLPERFSLIGAPPCDFWRPLAAEAAGARRLQHQYSVLGRLKAGVSMERAQSDMTAIARRLEQAYPDTNRGWGIAVAPVSSMILDMAERPIVVLACAVGFVLLLACANVAGLMLARGSARTQEMAIRASLGAGRWRIMRQVLTESVLLAVLGGTLGAVVANWLMAALRAVSPADFALDASLRLDGAALGFALGLAVLTGLGFGVAPAWYASRADVSAGFLKTRSGHVSRGRAMSALVAAEVALSMVLLIAAGLLTKDLALLARTSVGIRVERVLTFALDLPAAKYGNAGQVERFYDGLLGRMRAAPGVEAAAGVDTLPMKGAYSGGPFEIEGRVRPADWMDVTSQYIVCTPGYFSTLGVPVLAGRDFDGRDTAQAPLVAVVSEPLARRYFAGEDPFGRRIRFRGAWRTVVGVAGPVKRFARRREADPQIYTPAAQSEESSLWLVARTTGDPLAAAQTAREAVRELDGELPLIALGTMEEVRNRSLTEERVMAWSLTGFSGFALAIAATGIYGVIAWAVSRRTFEIGVRLALGASRGDILRMVLGRGVWLAVVGALAGLPLALGAAQGLSALLYGVSMQDPLVFAGVPAVLLAAAGLASYLPARRASRLDPSVALRAE
ncbi:MAG: ABC transporter permease [Acidobacteria bacterium]|nr:ABC transporter permease [Acidobacteriota bacterium]